MRRRESGATTAEFALVLVFLLLTGLVGWQFAQIGLTQFKVSNAAQQAAYTAASSLVINHERVPCWEVSNGLKDPALYGDPEVCRAITSSLGDLDPATPAKNASSRMPFSTAWSQAARPEGSAERWSSAW